MREDMSFMTEDLELIREALEDFESYSLAAEVSRRMEERGLSAVELGKRCGVSHTMANRWRKGAARPNGKERMKELGMALGMDEGELNSFLYRSGYPSLFAKNPFDSAARVILLRYAGDADAVQKYRELIHRLRLDDLTPKAPNSLESAVMSMELRDAAQADAVSTWFRAHERAFAADDKNMILGQRLAKFILLYIGDTTINQMAVTGELPVTLRNLLYPIFGEKAVAVRYLREKLISFGLYSDMTEEEIDVLLQCARLRPLSETVTAGDLAVLMAVRSGHERYPLYEYQNVSTVLTRLRAGVVRDSALEGEYAQRLTLSRKLADYYLNSERSDSELTYERLYTSYSDRGLMDYVHDLLCTLRGGGDIQGAETDLIIEYTSRTEGGNSIWS